MLENFQICLKVHYKRLVRAYLALADLLVSPRHPAGAGDGSEEGDGDDFDYCDDGDDCDDGDNDFCETRKVMIRMVAMIVCQEKEATHPSHLHTLALT